MSLSLRSVVADYAVDCNAPNLSVRDPAAVDALAVQPPPSSGLVSALSKEIESLKQQLDAQRRAYEHERSVRVCEERDRHHAQEDALKKYSMTIDYLQNLNNESTKDLVTYRHQQLIAERQLHGEIEVLKASLAEANAAVAKERSRQTADMHLAIHNSETRHQDIISKIRDDYEEKKSVFSIEKQRLEHTIHSLTEELNKTKSMLAHEKKAKRRLVEQHKYENVGLQTEINLMKQHLRAVEKKVYFTHMKGGAMEQ
jgi:hypothetical protein